MQTLLIVFLYCQKKCTFSDSRKRHYAAAHTKMLFLSLIGVHLLCEHKSNTVITGQYKPVQAFSPPQRVILPLRTDKGLYGLAGAIYDDFSVIPYP